MENNSNLYRILNVDPNCSPSQLKDAYYKLAKEYHPDKNPLAGDKFKEISHAYETLVNLKREEINNCIKRENFKFSDARCGSLPDDLFSQLFNSTNFKQDAFKAPFCNLKRSISPRKGKDIAHILKVSLEDLYNSKVFYPKLSKNVLCQSCQGTGSSSGKIQACSICNKTRFVYKYRPVGPMLQKVRIACTDCKGRGELPSKVDLCKECHGYQICRSKKIFQVQVEKGMKDGQRIYFEKEGDQTPLTVPGSIIFIIEQKPHDKFIRKNDDLQVEVKIKLTTALCGGRIFLKHLDNRDLLLSILPGEITKTGDIKVIHGEGMPIYQQLGLKGNLYVKFDIEFPSPYWFTPTNLDLLSQLLPMEEPLQPSDNYKEVILSNVETTTNPIQNVANDIKDEDNKEKSPTSYSGVQCAQQ